MKELLFSLISVSMFALTVYGGATPERSTQSKSGQTGIRYVIRAIDRGQIPDAYIFKSGKWIQLELKASDSRMRYPLPQSEKISLYRSAPTAEVKKPDLLAEVSLPKKHSSRMIGLLVMDEGEGRLYLFDEGEFYPNGIHFASIVPDLELKLELDNQEAEEFSQEKPLHLDYGKKANGSGEMMASIFYKNDKGDWMKMGSFLAQDIPGFSKISIISWDSKRKRPRMEHYTFYDERNVRKS